MVQKERFFGKIIAQKRCEYQCFCFLGLVGMESVIFEFVGIYGFVHVLSQNTVNTSVFGKAFQKHRKIQHFGHVVLPKCRK